MRKLELVLFFITTAALAQAPAPKAPEATPKVPVMRTGGAPTTPVPGPAFNEMEQATAKDIQEKQQKLQQEVNEFMAEVRVAHPGYEFSNGLLVPITPPPASKVKEEDDPCLRTPCGDIGGGLNGPF